MNEQLVDLLRCIRDTAWQYGRCHEEFSSIEQRADEALALLGVTDGVANPRPYCWWEKDKL